MRESVDRRRALLRAALGFLLFEPRMSAVHALHSWLDSWRGVGLIIEWMHRQGFTVSPRTTGAERGMWIAIFQGHSMTSPGGFAAAETPWAAVQRSAWGAMNVAR